MVERQLQEYLFANPEALFPGEIILERDREFWVQGKRIDLLFRTTEGRYIIELKAVPLSREHIGQVVEYYGLMRSLFKDQQFKMLLVAPSIPDFRKIFLEEIGIRCVEMPSIPAEAIEVERLHSDAVAYRKREQIEANESTYLSGLDSIGYDDLVRPVTKHSLAISHLLLRDSLAEIKGAFADYEVLPIKMMRADSADVLCAKIPVSLDSEPSFIGPGAWWAYAFGNSEEMPKNDVPNISTMAMPWCLDLAVNAELRTSQAVMKRRIAEEESLFDELLAAHGNLQFQLLLKLEHQPRFYHWIPLMAEDPGTWSAASFIEAVSGWADDYENLRDSWTGLIENHRQDLSRLQMLHMRARNRQPNFALRLVRQFRRDDKFWSFAYNEQRQTLINEYFRLKPFIDLLR